jgi:hypothetical protein
MSPVDETTMWKGGIGSMPAKEALVPPEIDRLVDQIMNARNSFGGDLSGGRKVAALTDVVRTIGGMENTRRSDMGQTARLGITEAGANERLGIAEGGADRRAAAERANYAERTGLLKTAQEAELAPPSPFLLNLFTSKNKTAQAAAPAAGASDWKKLFPNLFESYK